MSRHRRAEFCESCRSKVMFRWEEPPHSLHSAMTVSLLGGHFITPLTGVLMALVWAQRLCSTIKWACPHCSGGLR